MSSPPDDHEALDVLERYLVQLQAGQTPDREALLQTHPELASSLDCLEALECLAPAPRANSSPAVSAESSRISADECVAENGGNLAGNAENLASPLSVPGSLPRTFGQYELLCEIGRGGMGVVYQARQTGLDRTVALKMILGSHLASPEHVRRFQSEAKAAARVRHPHVVPIHEVGQIHGQDYFTMEYIEGRSLAQRIAEGPIGVETVVRLLAAVARAVDHLHQQGIVHRDLKPSNILLDGEGLPYVTDFGLAKVFAADSQTTASAVIAGTPSYMAPEQAAGHSSEIGPPADIYSLGAILYELLTGRPPFCEEHPLDTLVGVLGREPAAPRQLNPRVPRELELVCLKCLTKSPADRYASAGALADDLERFARAEAIQVRPPHLGQRLWSWTRRQPALASRLAALGLLYAASCSVEAVKYLAEGTVPEWGFYGAMFGLLTVWMLVSVVCQQFLDSRRWSVPACFVWGTLDSLLLLAALLLADGVASPLIVGYFLLIVGSGLWFRVRFVSFMTAVSVVSYGILVADFYWRRPLLGAGFDRDFDRHVIFVLALLLFGASVAYLVHRVRTLSSFFDRRMP